MASAKNSNQLGRDRTAVGPWNGVYDETTFRYLLQSESKRTERSGDQCALILIHCANAEEAILPMDPQIAKIVFRALSINFRDTDYIGWFCEGLAVGAVLTALGRDFPEDVLNRAHARVLQYFRTELDDVEYRCLQVRVYQHREGEGFNLADLSHLAR